MTTRRLAALATVLGVGLLGACSDSDGNAPFPGSATEREQTSTRKSRILDEAAMEGDNGVKSILVEYYHVDADAIDKVDCPGDQEAKQGNKFSCLVTLNGEEKVVDITVRDDDGQYEVGTPRDK
jgi:hypothetical protein